MYKNHKAEKIDPSDPYRPEFYGTFEIEVQVGGSVRRMLAYAPDDVRESTAAVIVLGPDNMSADEIMEKTSWCKLADQEECKEKMLVFFLEPENGHWNTEETYGMADGDVAYINTAALKATERYHYCAHESKIYMVGIREGGIMANMAVAANPAFYAGLASIDGSNVRSEYFTQSAQDYCTMLDGYEDPDHRKNIKKGDIAVPAWIIDDSKTESNITNNALRYWMSACGVDDTTYQVDPDCVEYRRTAETDYPVNQEKEAYRVRKSYVREASADLGEKLIRRIWKDFLYRNRRWMSCPGGDLRITKDPVRDLGAEYHYETIDGWNREWYVYVPESVKNESDKKVPLVIALHGYTCNGEIYIGNSGWTQVADKYGFVTVFPTALYAHVNMPEQGLMPEYAVFPAWNIFQEKDRPDELAFFNHMIDKTIESYPIDTKRIFASGHSWGSLMTQMLGLGMTDRLCAIAPCSGVFFGGASKTMTALPDLNRFPDVPLPVWMHWGTEEAWLIEPDPTHDNETGFTIEMWMKRNGMGDMIPEDWSKCPAVENGRFIDHRLEKDGSAPVWFTQVDYMPHATMPEMSFRIWEEFFSNYL